MALYLGHRESEDLDLFTEKRISADMLEQWKNDKVEIKSNYALVDIYIEEPEREVEINLLDREYMRKIKLQEPVKATKTGMKVAALLDVVIGKVNAVATRQTVRDYKDLAAMNRLIPETLERAMEIHINAKETKERDWTELRRGIMYFSWEIEAALENDEREEVYKIRRQLQRKETRAEQGEPEEEKRTNTEEEQDEGRIILKEDREPGT